MRLHTREKLSVKVIEDGLSRSRAGARRVGFALVAGENSQDRWLGGRRGA